MRLDIEEKAAKEQGLFDDELRVRVAFYLVLVQEFGGRHSLRDQIYLIHEIEGVPDSEIEPLSYEGGGLVGGITDREHVPPSPFFRDKGVEFVDCRSDYLDLIGVQVWRYELAY